MENKTVAMGKITNGEITTMEQNKKNKQYTNKYKENENNDK